MENKLFPRYEVEAGINNCLLIKDTYNSDLTSLTKHALSFLEQHSANQNMKRTLIVSDINGNDLVCEMFYANIRQVINSGAVNRVILLGPELSFYANDFSIEEKHIFINTEEFLKSSLLQSFENEAILLKVAPAFFPERIENHLQLLAHDTCLEINFDAMFHNIDYFRSKLDRSTKLMCTVKASAYGSGHVEVALALQHYGCDYIAVAYANEGVELRQAGITLPIVVLDPMVPAIHHVFKYNLEPEVFSFDFLNTLIKEAQSLNLKDFPIHIKLDTGMHRSGFTTDDIDQLIHILKNQSNLKVNSIFTHLAAAEDTDPKMEAFTQEQFVIFEDNAMRIKDALDEDILLHALNTAGIERHSEYQYDMVRLGIGLWGVNCENEDKLRNVCSLSTKIMQIKTIPPGETVGYNRRGTISRTSEIALLPLGYADGIDRRLGNGVGSFFLNGEKIYIIGNVCMDLVMVDVTGMNAKVGDKVIIFNDKQGLSDIAKLLKTIPYEVLTSISPRVRRVYYRE